MYWRAKVLKFVFTLVRGPSESIQLQEVAFYDPDGKAIAVSSIENPSGSSPIAHTPERAADGHVSTKGSKWLDLNFGASKRSTLLLTLANESFLGSYELWTANDNPARDPVGWQIHLQIGESWLEVDSRVVLPPEGRFESYGRMQLPPAPFPPSSLPSTIPALVSSPSCPPPHLPHSEPKPSAPAARLGTVPTEIPSASSETSTAVTPPLARNSTGAAPASMATSPPSPATRIVASPPTPVAVITHNIGVGAATSEPATSAKGASTAHAQVAVTSSTAQLQKALLPPQKAVGTKLAGSSRPLAAPPPSSAQPARSPRVSPAHSALSALPMTARLVAELFGGSGHGTPQMPLLPLLLGVLAVTMLLCAIGVGLANLVRPRKRRRSGKYGYSKLGGIRGATEEEGAGKSPNGRAGRGSSRNGRPPVAPSELQRELLLVVQGLQRKMDQLDVARSSSAAHDGAPTPMPPAELRPTHAHLNGRSHLSNGAHTQHSAVPHRSFCAPCGAAPSALLPPSTHDAALVRYPSHPGMPVPRPTQGREASGGMAQPYTSTGLSFPPQHLARAPMHSYLPSLPATLSCAHYGLSHSDSRAAEARRLQLPSYPYLSSEGGAPCHLLALAPQAAAPPHETRGAEMLALGQCMQLPSQASSRLSAPPVLNQPAQATPSLHMPHPAHSLTQPPTAAPTATEVTLAQSVHAAPSSQPAPADAQTVAAAVLSHEMAEGPARRKPEVERATAAASATANAGSDVSTSASSCLASPSPLPPRTLPPPVLEHAPPPPLTSTILSDEQSPGASPLQPPPLPHTGAHPGERLPHSSDARGLSAVQPPTQHQQHPPPPPPPQL
uniref:Uncharacterized protein n=1 Tax=Chrysotila carterae TaxID=13221 RepID=A0A7S4BDV3_CHRCT